MANTLVDELLRVTAANGAAQNADGVVNLSTASDALRALTSQLNVLSGLYEAQSSRAQEDAVPAAQNTRARVTEVASALTTVTGAAGGILGGGLTLAPLISGIARLFGFGASQPELAPLTQFTLPGPVALEGAVSQAGASSVAAISYGQNGLPRAIPPGGSNISVNVQTFDSRSFLDHSEEIARAVREAMLSSHALNDVIAEV